MSADEREGARRRLVTQARISRHILRGYLANWRRQLQEGTREYRKALKLDPEDEGVKFALGIASVHKQRALATLARQPGDLKSLSRLGYIAWSEQRYDEAVRRFREVLAIDPRQAAAYVHLGMSYAAQERFEASIAAYREAGHLNPDLGKLVDQSIDLVERLQQAKARPADPDAQRRLGEIYAADGRSDRALECFERVVALAPQRPEGFWSLARQYEAEGRDADALRTYGRGLDLDPENGWARNNYEKLAIKVALDSGKPASMSVGSEPAVVIDPSRGAGYYQLGLRYLRNDEPAEATAVLRQAVALAPDDDAALLFLGLAQTSLGAYAEAEAALRRAIALRPTNPHAYNYLGLVYHQQRRYRQALSAYGHAVEQDSGYAVAYVNLAATHEALGDTREALAAYRQALRYDGNLRAVQEKIDALSRSPER